MKKVLSFLSALFAAAALFAEQEVRLGLTADSCDAGETFTVPVEVRDLRNVASVFVQVAYDPLVLIFKGAAPGSDNGDFVDFVSSHEAGMVKILTYGTNNIERLSGVIANLTFEARYGSAGLYSDLTLAKVCVNEKTMTEDLTVANPIVVKSAMLFVTEPIGGGVEIESKLTLSDEDKAALVKLLGSVGREVSRVVVQGEQMAVEMGLDLGIKPDMVAGDGVATATFNLPTIEITGIDIVAQQIKAKIIPAPGAEITASPVTSIIHIYGTDELTLPMSEVSVLNVDIANYLNDNSKGEMAITFQFEGKNFFRVVAGRVVASELPLE